MMEDLISVIVPIYNVDKYLSRCIKSILNQTYKNLEIILVDDGSTDNSLVLCKKFRDKNNNIILVHKKNGGLGSARNAGLDHATGKYIMFVDGDDFILDDHIENMYRFLIMKKADTCLSGHTRIYENKYVVYSNPCLNKLYCDNEILEQLLVRMCGKLPAGNDNIEMSVCMALFSNNIVKKHKIRFVSEREFISEDLVFDFDYYKYAKKVCVSSDVGYCYCDNLGSLTTKYRSDRFEMQKKMTNKVLEMSEKNKIKELVCERTFTTFLAIARYSIKLEVKYCNVNGRKQMKKNIENICNDQMLQVILKDYNNGLVPIKSRIINSMMKRKLINLLIIVMMIKNLFNV